MSISETLFNVYPALIIQTCPIPTRRPTATVAAVVRLEQRLRTKPGTLKAVITGERIGTWGSAACARQCSGRPFVQRQRVTTGTNKLSARSTEYRALKQSAVVITLQICVV